MPRVSVITPCYNAGQFIASTLESVAAQTFEDWEHIVVDDGSEDRSAEIVAAAASGDARVRLVSKPNGGVASARNAGFRAASPSSDYLLFLDGDDVLDPTMLERLVRYLDEHDNVGAAYTEPVLMEASGIVRDNQWWLDRFVPAGRFGVRRLGADEPDTPWITVYALAGVLPSATVIRRAAYEQTPGWDESFGQPCEDTDLFLSIATVSEIHLVPGRLVRYRTHGAQSVADEARLREQERRLYAKWRAIGSAPGGPAREVARADRFVLRIRLAHGVRAAATSLRTGQVLRAIRFVGGALRRYGLPLLLGRRNPLGQ